MQKEFEDFWNRLPEGQSLVAVRMLTESYCRGVHNTLTALLNKKKINIKEFQAFNDRILGEVRKELVQMEKDEKVSNGEQLY